MTVTARRAPFNILQLASGVRGGGFEFFAEMQQHGGDLVYVPVLPGVTNFLVFSPDLAYQVLVKHPERYRKPTLAKDLFKATFGNGIFFSEGEFWRRQRKLAQPAFHYVRIQAYAESMVAETLRRVSRWQNGSVVDIDAEMHALALVIVVNALFKTDVSEWTQRVGQAMQQLGAATKLQITSVPQFLMSRLPESLPFTLNHSKRQAVRAIDEILYRLIADHRQSGADTGDLLSMFLQARDEETGEGMSDSQIRDELMTLFIAGHETSALALGWALLEVARRPEVEARLAAELATVLQGRPPAVADLARLPYTQKVIKETLRMYPPAVFVARQPLAPLELGGVTVRPSDQIIIMIYTMHRDARWFPDPERFNPDRFAEEIEKSLPKCAYIPFGNGPRICIGSGFATMEMQLVLATLVQRFRFTVPPGAATVKPAFGPTLGFDGSLRLEVHSR